MPRHSAPHDARRWSEDATARRPASCRRRPAPARPRRSSPCAPTSPPAATAGTSAPPPSSPRGAARPVIGGKVMGVRACSVVLRREVDVHRELHFHLAGFAASVAVAELELLNAREALHFLGLAKEREDAEKVSFKLQLNRLFCK